MLKSPSEIRQNSAAYRLKAPRTIGIEVWLAMTPTDPNTRSFLTMTNRREAEPVRALRG